MGKKKVTGSVVSNAQQKEIPAPMGFEQDRVGLIGDLLQVSQGAAQILTALSDRKVSGVTAGGLAEALRTVADEVALYLFEEPVEAGTPEHELYVLEKRCAKAREKVAKEGGQS